MTFLFIALSLHGISLNKNNYKKGYPIFGFDIPGIVYALNGISPGMPYYFNKLTRDCRALQRFVLKNNPPIIMLICKIKYKKMEDFI